MDCKYMERLLERYWQCETSVEEESELRAFFSKGEVPAHLLPYRDLFVYQQAQREAGLGEEFDARMLARIEPPVVKARRLTWRRRCMPLFKAAAVVACMLSLGSVAQRMFFADESTEYNHDAYTGAYDDSEAACKEVSSALMMLSERVNESKEHSLADSVRRDEVDVIPPENAQ